MFDLRTLSKKHNNPRTISQREMAKLKKSVTKFSKMLPLRPIVYDPISMEVLGGNQRLVALIETGHTIVSDEWVRPATDFTEEEMDLFVIADNANFGENNLDLIQSDFMHLDLESFGLDIDFDLGSIGDERETESSENDNSLTATEDEYEMPDDEEIVETDIKEGDLFEVTNGNGIVHRLLCGDSTNSDDVDLLMNNRKADIVFTDPPYGYSYESNYQKKHKELLNDDKILPFMENAFFYAKENCAFYVCCGWQTISEWISEVKSSGLMLKNIIIWKKNNWSMGDLKGAYAGQYEIILFAHKGRVELKNGRGQDVWEFDRTPPTLHPTMKPVELVGKALKDNSSPKDIVTDFFLGSGTTMVASHQLERNCYGIELSPTYCQIIVDRMKALDEGIEVTKIN